MLAGLDGASSSSDGVPSFEVAHGGASFPSLISINSELLLSQVACSDATMELSSVDPMYVHRGLIVVCS